MGINNPQRLDDEANDSHNFTRLLGTQKITLGMKYLVSASDARSEV